MIIGIDACPLIGRITGIGRYVLEICRELDKAIPEAEFLLYSPKPLSVELPPVRWQVRVVGSCIASSYVWLKTAARKQALKDGVQVFWATRTISPGPANGFCTISTVHDLNYKIFPASMPYATLWAHRLWFARDLRRADRVVANSQGTADRLRHMLGVTADAVVRPALSAAFRRQAQKAVTKRLSALGVQQPYFLAVGTIEPRKNLSALIEAFTSLKYSGELSRHELLIVGSRGWKNYRLQRILCKAKNLGVRWLGFLPDEDLAALYAGSQAFVFPSLYEGFGIPAAEARACGATLVASDMPELREAGGPGAIYIKPTVHGISEGLKQAANGGLTFGCWKFPYSWRTAGNMMAEQFKFLL